MNTTTTDPDDDALGLPTNPSNSPAKPPIAPTPTQTAQPTPEALQSPASPSPLPYNATPPKPTTPPKRIGRPPNPKPPPPPPAPPLAPGEPPPPRNKRFEQIARLVGSGFTQTDAYIATSKKKVKPLAAKSRASEICNMPEVVARVNWFKMQAKNGAKTPPEDTLQEENRTTSQVSPQNSTLQDITQDEIAALITRTLRNKPTAAEVASLTTALLKIKPQLAESERTDKPDPAAVIAYVASFAGMAGKQIIGELGGPRLLVERMCQVLAQTPAQMRDMFQSVVDQNVSQ